MSRKSDTPEPEPSGAERREHQRFDTSISVDYASGETFLFAYLQNISEMGIFVLTTDPLRVGTKMKLTFAPPGAESFQLEGSVAWVNRVKPDGDNPNPGMGIRFINLQPDERERLVDVIRTIAYLRESPAYD